MLTGTQLVLLAMYSTVNVVGPAGSHINASYLPYLLATLIAAGVMTCLQVHLLTRVPPQRVYKGPKSKPVRRKLVGPAPRRV